IPNSGVKHTDGEDSWRAASRKNSSVPGLLFEKALLAEIVGRAFAFEFFCSSMAAELVNFSLFLFIFNSFD
ncbi:MAG TPA: hypothetical protein V6C65_03290, partial [Allocoleopsis sp.]